MMLGLDFTIFHLLAASLGQEEHGNNNEILHKLYSQTYLMKRKSASALLFTTRAAVQPKAVLLMSLYELVNLFFLCFQYCMAFQLAIQPHKARLVQPRRIRLGQPCKARSGQPGRVRFGQPCMVTLGYPCRVRFSQPCRVRLDQPCRVGLGQPCRANSLRGSVALQSQQPYGVNSPIGLTALQNQLRFSYDKVYRNSYRKNVFHLKKQ